jgi:hypothetical protein
MVLIVIMFWVAQDFNLKISKIAALVSVEPPTAPFRYCTLEIRLLGLAVWLILTIVTDKEACCFLCMITAYFQLHAVIQLRSIHTYIRESTSSMG